MRAQKFHAIRIIKVAIRFKFQQIELSITCMKRLRAHPWDFTCASKLASGKPGFTYGKGVTIKPENTRMQQANAFFKKKNR